MNKSLRFINLILITFILSLSSFHHYVSLPKKIIEPISCGDFTKSSRNSDDFENNSKRTQKERYICSYPRSNAPIVFAAVLGFFPNLINAKTQQPTRPSTEDINTIFRNNDWGDEKDVLRKSNFRRLDESEDNIFYDQPRFVEHIDSNAVKSLIDFHENYINRYFSNKPIDIVDICSSWVSHISDKVKTNHFLGVGMNTLELDKNNRLNARIVQDLNKDYKLNIKDNSFDVALIQLSIDYLIHPIEVLKEISRILKPGGILIVSFSNRIFFNKAVALWTGKSDIDHFETIGEYLYFSGGYNEPYQGYDCHTYCHQLNGVKSMSENGDPIYAVVASKRI
eukprot:gene6409-8822_t